MKTRNIMNTYKELINVKKIFEQSMEPVKKSYWVGTDECGVMVVTMDIHDIKGLDNVMAIEATNSMQARIIYSSKLN